MPLQVLAKRIERLEEQMTSLQDLPGRVADLTSRFQQFRDETRLNFSAMQSEVRHVSHELDSLRTEFQGLRNDTAQQLGSIRAEFRQFRSAISEQVQSLRNEFQGLRDEFQHLGEDTAQQFQSLRTDFQVLRTDVKTEMRILYEDLVDRLALLQEGKPVRQKPRPS